MNSKASIPPLHGIPLSSRPVNSRGIAWSKDAELAVASDDSVTIYVPHFPFLDPSQPLEFVDKINSLKAVENGIDILPGKLTQYDEVDESHAEAADDDDDDDDEDDALGLEPAQREAKDRASQFSEDTARRLWVSHPPLHPELNLHVWEAAGKAMPVIRSAVAAVEKLTDGDAMVVDAPPAEAEAGVPSGEEEQEPSPSEDVEPNMRPGAGTGAIGGSGSSLNHVVAIEWSPLGVGRNQRPVLAVLTGCGSLVVYGEGGPLPFGSMAKPSRLLDRGKGTARELKSWLVLWAVGEKFVLPGQGEYGYGEFIKAFAWSREMGKGKALLAYMNDLNEIVVLCVGTIFQTTTSGLEEAVWNVQELARLETRCPHALVVPNTPSYIPSGSSFCLRWGPWIKGEDTWSCLLCFTLKHWVAFKKITVNTPAWNPREAPILTYEVQDWDGLCMHLGADAFVEFEDTISIIDGRPCCRGVIATPMIAESFQVPVDTQAGYTDAHSTDECGTTFPSTLEHNPITGLVMHNLPLGTMEAPAKPLYTAVRFSATATNKQWWESNAHLPTPQWAVDINAQVKRLTSFSKAIHEGNPGAETAADGGDGIVPPAPEPADASGDAENSDDENEDENEQEEADLDVNFDPWATAGPVVHPYNMRLWGLALSPGGGSSAVLATPLLTQRPMRGAWNTHRSRVMFGHAELGPKARTDGEGDVVTEKSSGGGSAVAVEGLSTEARMWEWMHGGGPQVPGLTPDYPPESDLSLQRAAQLTRDLDARALRDTVMETFRPFVAAQQCELCGGGKFRPIMDRYEQGNKQQGEQQQKQQQKQKEQKKGRFLDAECPQGHRVAVCGATGLAIQAPGTSRACGVCQCRCLNWAYLVETVLHSHNRAADFVREHMVRDFCARCGGKYID